MYYCQDDLLWYNNVEGTTKPTYVAGDETDEIEDGSEGLKDLTMIEVGMDSIGGHFLGDRSHKDLW
jgi:hypothetical protein